jgi:hypothetical protein
VTANNPFYKGPSAPKPRRTLEEAPLSERPQHASENTTQVQSEDLRKLFDAFGFQINRATALLRELAPRVSKLSIPVDVNATAVRAAVRRRLQGTDGSSIPFSLYKDMIDYRVKTARKITHEIAGELTGNALADAQVIRKYMKSGGRGYSAWEEFLLSMEPFLLWMLFTQLQGQFTCVEHQECTVAKEPPGTEVGPTQMRNAIAVAAMMLIMGLQEQHVLFAVQQPAGNLGIPPVELINRARKLLDTDLHREVNQIVGASDPELIIAYCDEYIGRHTEAYLEWIAYRDVLHTRERTTTIYIRSHQYSKEYSTLVDYAFESVHETPIAGTGLFGGAGRTSVQYVGMEPINVSTQQFGAFVNELKAVDRTLSSIAGVLTSGFGEDLLCCVARFLGAEDVKRLRKIRHVLRVARGFMANGLNMADPFSILDMALDQIQQQVMALVGRYFDQFGRDILSWVGDTDGTDWDSLFNCPLIEDLIVTALGAVRGLQDRIMEMVQQFMGRTFGFHNRIYSRWGNALDLRRVDTLLAILEGLISDIERCARLGDGDGTTPTPAPNPGENPSVWSGVPRPLNLPPEVVQKFFGNTNPVLRQPGQRPIPPVGTIISASNVQASGRNFQDICRGILPDELIASIERKRSANG